MANPKQVPKPESYLHNCFTDPTQSYRHTAFSPTQPEVPSALIIQYMQWECLVISPQVAHSHLVRCCPQNLDEPLEQGKQNPRDPGEKSIQLHWEWTWKLLLLISKSKKSDRTKHPGLCLNVPTLVLIHWVPFYWQEWLYAQTLLQTLTSIKKPSLSFNPGGLRHLIVLLTSLPHHKENSLVLAFPKVHLKSNICINPHVHSKADGY